MTWEFTLEPSTNQVSEIEHLLEVCHNAWNFALWERKDWLSSRQSPINACSIRPEFILSPDAPFPNYPVPAKQLTNPRTKFPQIKTVALQSVLRTLNRSFEDMKAKGRGFPRFKQPPLGFVKVPWSREIPKRFEVKQARMAVKQELFGVTQRISTPTVRWVG